MQSTCLHACVKCCDQHLALCASWDINKGISVKPGDLNEWNVLLPLSCYMLPGCRWSSTWLVVVGVGLPESCSVLGWLILIILNLFKVWFLGSILHKGSILAGEGIMQPQKLANKSKINDFFFFNVNLQCLCNVNQISAPDHAQVSLQAGQRCAVTASGPGWVAPQWLISVGKTAGRDN